MKLVLIFTLLSIVNVVFSTIRSITTIKSGKTIASLISGGYFAFYNIVLIYSVADFSLLAKCAITFICNVIGVWIVKFVEEKMRKDRLWKVECTIHKYEGWENVILCLRDHGISCNYIDAQKYIIINCFCETQAQSVQVKKILEPCEAKYFASEAQIF